MGLLCCLPTPQHTSGYDGPWTRNPLRFDNQYFRNLLHLEWVPKQWDGPFQYVDAATGELMMLPTDMALKTDAKFRPWVEAYANDEQLFFRDFAAAFGKLLTLGCPAECDPTKPPRKASLTPQAEAGAAFRENAMHGSVGLMKKFRPQVRRRRRRRRWWWWWWLTRVNRRQTCKRLIRCARTVPLQQRLTLACRFRCALRCTRPRSGATWTP